MDLCDPVSIILVTAGSRGQNLLFRYPFSAPYHTERREKGTKLLIDLLTHLQFIIAC